jgi:indolepyruvate ferredoxin oxidoreductase alpha subunit
MTGLQEHPGTGRSLDHRRARAISIEAVARAMGLDAVHVVNPVRESRTLRALLADALAGDRLTLIVARHPCVLAAGKIRAHERAIEQDCEHNPGAQGGRGP